MIDISWTQAVAVWRRNLTVYRRTWTMNILPNFFEPLLYLVGMGVGLGAYLGEEVGGMTYVAFITPGLLASAAMNGAVFETTYNVYVKMHFGRLYDAFLASPAQVQDIALGELLWAVTRAMIYGVAFLAVAGALTAAGLPLLSAPTAWLLPLVALGAGALFASIGLLFTAYVRSIDLFSYFYTLFYTPLFLFSGIFFPVDRFPYGEQVAWFTPLYHVVRVSRALAHGGWDASHTVSVLWVLVATALCFAAIPGRLRRKLVR